MQPVSFISCRIFPQFGVGEKSVVRGPAKAVYSASHSEEKYESKMRLAAVHGIVVTTNGTLLSCKASCAH